MHERASSGSAGQRITKILQAATAAAEEHRRRISTATINMVVRDTVNWRQPPTLRGSNRKGRIYYATQVCTAQAHPFAFMPAAAGTARRAHQGGFPDWAPGCAVSLEQTMALCAACHLDAGFSCLRGSPQMRAIQARTLVR